jgi:hypothetical protein
MFKKKSKEEWEAEALVREAESLVGYSEQYKAVAGSTAGQVLLLAHELRLLRSELKWVATHLKKLGEKAGDDKVPF